MGLPDLQAGDYVVCISDGTTRVQQPSRTLINTNKDGKMHPEYDNPPKVISRFTDEDYALVLNAWRRELGLGPLV